MDRITYSIVRGLSYSQELERFLIIFVSFVKTCMNTLKLHVGLQIKQDKYKLNIRMVKYK